MKAPPSPSKVPLQLKIDKNKSKILKICAKLNNVYLALMLHSAMPHNSQVTFLFDMNMNSYAAGQAS